MTLFCYPGQNVTIQGSLPRSRAEQDGIALHHLWCNWVDFVEQAICRQLQFLSLFPELFYAVSYVDRDISPVQCLLQQEPHQRNSPVRFSDRALLFPRGSILISSLSPPQIYSEGLGADLLTHRNSV